jgi:hypothetical protein
MMYSNRSLTVMDAIALTAFLFVCLPACLLACLLVQSDNKQGWVQTLAKECLKKQNSVDSVRAKVYRRAL